MSKVDAVNLAALDDDVRRDVALPCVDCGTTTAPRSACPLCAKVYCQPCAEKPYETCCDSGVMP